MTAAEVPVIAGTAGSLPGKTATAWRAPEFGLSGADLLVVTFSDGRAVFAKGATTEETVGWLRNEHRVVEHLRGTGLSPPPARPFAPCAAARGLPHLEGGPPPWQVCTEPAPLTARPAGPSLCRACASEQPDWLRRVFIQLASINLKWPATALGLPFPAPDNPA